MNKLIYTAFLALVFICSCAPETKELPILGKTKMIDGETIYHKVPDFKMLHQDSIAMTQDSLNTVYLADFFFTHCPSICPKVTKQMLRIYDKYENDPRIKLVSFSIDPERDTVDKLKQYSSNLEVRPDKWYFLTGDKYETLDLADEYFVAAFEDPEAPGGFDHSGRIILVDTNKHIRAAGEGTDPESITDLLKQIDILLESE